MAWFGVIVLGEVVYLWIWQGVAPMAVFVSQQTESDQRQHEYQQCSFSASKTSTYFFVASIVTKAVWLCLGALLAFSTRSVSDAFNESKVVALQIYNVIFSVGLIAPLITLTSAIGDALTTLLVFAITWVSFLCMLILFVPKIVAVRAAQSAIATTPVTSDPDDPGEFSFVSLTHLGSPSLLSQYVTALERHLIQARSHLAAQARSPTYAKGVKIVGVGKLTEVASPVSGVKAVGVASLTSLPASSRVRPANVTLNRLPSPISKTVAVAPLPLVVDVHV